MKSIHAVVPRQQVPEPPCPSWCAADHHGEPSGLRSHWGAVDSVAPELAPLQLVDLSQVDGLEPLVTLHSAAGGHATAFSLEEAEAYAVAILTAVVRARAGLSWAVA